MLEIRANRSQTWHGGRRPRSSPRDGDDQRSLAEVEDRAAPGLRDGDLTLGENSRSVVATFVERSPRLTLLLQLPNRKSAEQVETAMREAITALPVSLTRMITWDQGAEMAKHAEFTTITGIPNYFCDPHSP